MNKSQVEKIVQSETEAKNCEKCVCQVWSCAGDGVWRVIAKSPTNFCHSNVYCNRHYTRWRKLSHWEIIGAWKL